MSEDRLEIAAAELAVAKPVRVTLPREVAYDLDKFQAIQKEILGKLGCLPCCSGFDIRWDFEQRFVVDSKLNIRSL